MSSLSILSDIDYNDYDTLKQLLQDGLTYIDPFIYPHNKVLITIELPSQEKITKEWCNDNIGYLIQLEKGSKLGDNDLLKKIASTIRNIAKNNDDTLREVIYSTQEDIKIIWIDNSKEGGGGNTNNILETNNTNYTTHTDISNEIVEQIKDNINALKFPFISYEKKKKAFNNLIQNIDEFYSKEFDEIKHLFINQNTQKVSMQKITEDLQSWEKGLLWKKIFKHIY